MSKTILNQLPDLKTLELDQLISLQGQLKVTDNELAAKLTASLVRNGIVFPLFVWRAPEGTDYLLDGVHRVLCLRHLRDNGYAIPPVPVVEIEANTKAEAKRMVLMATTNFSKTTKSGLKAFTHGIEVPRYLGELNIMGLNMQNLDAKKRKAPGSETIDPLAHRLQLSEARLENLIRNMRVVRDRDDVESDTEIIVRAVRALHAREVGEKVA